MSYRRLLILILGALILTACAPQPADPKSRFLRGDPCKPPCIEGIEPGVTSLAEAELMLADSPYVSADYVELESIEGIPLLIWSYPDNEWNGRANSGASGEASMPIRGISWSGPDICLTDIIGAYGEPDKLFLIAYQATGWIIVIWDE